MKYAKIVRNYFRRNTIDKWDYGTFNSFMKEEIGYVSDISISRVYIRLLKEFIRRDDEENYKKEVAKQLVKRINNGNIEVKVLLL